MSLADGYECITNATFNGVNTSATYAPVNLSESAEEISVSFRSRQMNGTLLYVRGSDPEQYLRLALQGGRLIIEVPEAGIEPTIATFHIPVVVAGQSQLHQPDGGNAEAVSSAKVQSDLVSDGDWHTLKLNLFNGIVAAILDGSPEERLTLNAAIGSLSTFVTTSRIIAVGASAVTGRLQEDVALLYNVEGASDIRVNASSQDDQVAVVGIRNGRRGGLQDMADFFRGRRWFSFTIVVITVLTRRLEDRVSFIFYEFFWPGCMSEVRIGGILLPFYPPEELSDSRTSTKFEAVEIRNLAEECTVCYENECLNGGACSDPAEVFECSCPAGFEDPICGTNINECLFHQCYHGACVDEVANYSCACEPGWTGRL